MRELIARWIYPTIFESAERFANTKKLLYEKIDSLVDELDVLTESFGILQETHQELLVSLNHTSIIDEYLMERYPEINPIAYQNKRAVKYLGKGSGPDKEFYNVYLNQMITPDVWEVENFYRRSVHITDDFNRIQHLGNRLAKHTTWINEQDLYTSGDFYLYPEETLTVLRSKTDCEDVSFCMVSFEPEIGAVCYGWYHKNGQKFGHAWPVFLLNGSLWIAETTGNSVQMVPHTSSNYEPFFIFTKNKTFRVKTGLQFGTLAHWN